MGELPCGSIKSRRITQTKIMRNVSKLSKNNTNIPVANEAYNELWVIKKIEGETVSYLDRIVCFN